MDQDAYTSQFNQLSERYTAVHDQLVILEKSIQDIQYRKIRTDMFLETLKQQESLIPEFSTELWYSLVDHATVYSKEDIRVIFKNGVEIKALFGSNILTLHK